MTEPTATTEVEVELSAEDFSQIIGDELILERKGRPFSYLAGLAFDGMRGSDDIVDILVEYIENETEFDLSDEDVSEVECILRGGYDGE